MGRRRLLPIWEDLLERILPPSPSRRDPAEIRSWVQDLIKKGPSFVADEMFAVFVPIFRGRNPKITATPFQASDWY